MADRQNDRPTSALLTPLCQIVKLGGFLLEHPDNFGGTGASLTVDFISLGIIKIIN